MIIVHRFRSGGYIARDGAAVEVCIGPGPDGVPMVVRFEGEALAGLTAAAIAAFREREVTPEQAVKAAAESNFTRGLMRAAERMLSRKKAG